MSALDCIFSFLYGTFLLNGIDYQCFRAQRDEICIRILNFLAPMMFIYAVSKGAMTVTVMIVAPVISKPPSEFDKEFDRRRWLDADGVRKLVRQ